MKTDKLSHKDFGYEAPGTIVIPYSTHDLLCASLTDPNTVDSGEFEENIW